ncbi:MAG: 2-C-methyl-D-erythritol 4-phosphate cytidylyltransferase [Candidatus Omnitrophota bacterium]
MSTQAIVVAAGPGSRLPGPVVKPLINLKKKPLFIYCLQVFDEVALIDSVILVVSREHVDEFKRALNKYKINKSVRIVEGGPTRCQSVRNGLKNLDEKTSYVLIHDGVRPFARKELVREAIILAQKEKAVVVGVPVKPTIKEINVHDMTVRKTPDRNQLWEVQTPQIFSKDIIAKAHEENQDLNVTDDAVLVEKLGIRVKMIQGRYDNIKITTQEDLRLAEALLDNQNSR